MKSGGPLKRNTPLTGGKQLDRKTPLKAKASAPKPRSALPRPTQPIKQQSSKQAAKYVERRKMLVEKTGGEPVLCARCNMRWAVDGHELLRRSQGGSISDPDNVVCVCRECHGWFGSNPVEAAAEGWVIRRDGGRRDE